MRKNTNSKALCVFLQSSRKERKGEDEVRGKRDGKDKQKLRYGA